MASFSLLPTDEPEGDFLDFYSKFNLVAAPVAIAVSYARNRNLKWALIHGFIGAPYLAYVAFDLARQGVGAQEEEAEFELERAV